MICFAEDTINKVKAKDRLGKNICNTYNRGLIFLIYHEVLQMDKWENKTGKEVKVVSGVRGHWCGKQQTVEGIKKQDTN